MSATAAAAAPSKAGVPASSVGLLKTMTSADGGSAELGPEERLGPGRFEVVEDEAAGRQDARDARRERDRGEQDERPDADHQPRPTRDEAAKAIEGAHGISILVAGAEIGPWAIW